MVENIKKIGLFLFGIVLVVWGYKANATTNEQAAEKANEASAQAAQNQSQATAGATQKADAVGQTTVESGTAEEASATQ